MTYIDDWMGIWKINFFFQDYFKNKGKVRIMC